MPDSDNFYNAARIMYGINHSVIPDTNTPAILRARKFEATGGARLCAQGAKPSKHSDLDDLL